MSVHKGNKVISVYKGDKLIASNMAAGTSTVTPQYIRDQNILDMTNEASKFKLTEATSKDTAVQMPYDGILSLQTNYDSRTIVFVLDKNKQQKYVMRYDALRDLNNNGSSDAGNLVFCKDDYLYFTFYTRPSAMTLYFYKKRDYTGR